MMVQMPQTHWENRYFEWTNFDFVWTIRFDNFDDFQTLSNASVSGSTSDSTFFDIHEKLRELYVYLYLKDLQDSQVDNRVSMKI